MNIDWSKAPEGATHYFVGAASGEWRDLSGKTWEYWHKGAWFNSGLSSSHLLTYPGDMIAVQRPPLEWTGEGLPPVGTVCEVCSDLDSWEVCTVLAHNGSDVVFVDAKGIYGGLDELRRFRVHRTPEQIAAEERRKAIDQMVQFFMNYYGNPKGAEQYLLICRSLYDAGYRKQEQTK